MYNNCIAKNLKYTISKPKEHEVLVEGAAASFTIDLARHSVILAVWQEREKFMQWKHRWRSSMFNSACIA